MKITKIETFLMKAGAPAVTAWATAGNSAANGGGMSTGGSRHWCFVKVHTDEGIYGVGEGSGWPKVVAAGISDLEAIVIGEDPMNIEKIWLKMHLALMGHGMTGTVGGGAITAIEMALWDIKGKVLNTPVWNLLGGKIRDSIPAYCHVSLPEQALHYRDKYGYSAFKTGNVYGTVKKVEKIRHAVGDHADLMVDLHGAPWMTVADAIRVGKDLEQFDLLFFEDPVAPECIEDYARIRDQVNLPLAAGERWTNMWGMRPLIERGLVDVIQPDTGRAGGLSQMKKMAAMAEANFITVAPHSGTLGPIAEFAAVHLLASLPNSLILEKFAEDCPERYKVVTSALEVVNGRIAVPNSPGLGVDLVEEEIRNYPAGQNCSVPGNPGSLSYAEGTWSEHVYYQPRYKGRPVKQ